MDAIPERVEPSGRRPLGRLVQLGLQLFGLVVGGVGLEGHAPAFPWFASACWGRALPSGRVVLSRPSPVLRPHSNARRLPGDFPLGRLYAWPPPGLAAAGAGLGLPQFPCPPSGHPVSPTPGSSSAPALPGLRRLPW